MAEYLEETLEQLIGNAKLSNDFFSTKYKVRYSASPNLVPGHIGECALLFQSLYDINPEVNISTSYRHILGVAFELLAQGLE